MNKTVVSSIGILALALLGAGPATSTPPDLVSAYDSLANTILAAKATESNMVRSILSATYSHAEAVLAKARKRSEGRQGAKDEVEQLAALVAQLGNEGDAAVAAIRKRLIDGGHHHNAEGEKQGIYDEGFVIVTRASKKVFLDAASRIGRMAATADAAALDAEWKTVEAEYKKLLGTAGR